MRVEFYVEGSKGNTYRVAFWKKDGEFSSHCTCPNGRFGGKLCKHRLALLRFDVTNLASNNLEDFEILKEISKGSTLIEDEKEKAEKKEQVNEAKKFIKSIIKIEPPYRHKTIDVTVAIECLKNGGFGKGYGGGKNYFAIYTANKEYIGSVKTKRSPFNTDLKELFQEIELIDGIFGNMTFREVLIAEQNSEIGLTMQIV